MRKSIVLLFALVLLAPVTAPLSAQVVTREVPGPRGYLGFSFQREARNGDDERTLNLTVTGVVGNSPAETGGLQVGDVILRLNGVAATEPLLTSISGSLAPGDTVRLRVRRDGANRDLRLIAAEPPAGYFVARNLYADFSPDSIRGMLRIFVDSLEAGLDTTRFRFFSRMPGDSGRVFVFTDSSGTGDSVIVKRFERRIPGGVFRFDTTFGPPVDSIFRELRFDSTFRGRIHMGDGDRYYELTVPGTPGHDRLMVFGMGARALAGARLETLNPELGRYFQSERGVLVLEVPEGTPARRAGLQAGDVITSAGGTDTDDVGDVYRAFMSARNGAVRLEILRQGQRRSLELRK